MSDGGTFTLLNGLLAAARTGIVSSDATGNYRAATSDPGCRSI
jgi:hypothetical protein